MDFALALAVRPPTVHLTALGELDIFTARLMTRTLGAALGVGCHEVLVDVAGVTFVDASALGVLDRSYRALTGDATITFVEVSPTFRQLCALTGLDTVFGLAQPAMVPGGHTVASAPVDARRVQPPGPSQHACSES